MDVSPFPCLDFIGAQATLIYAARYTADPKAEAEQRGCESEKADHTAKLEEPEQMGSQRIKA